MSRACARLVCDLRRRRRACVALARDNADTGIIGALGTVIVLVNAVLTWTRRRGFWVKLHAALLLLACLGVLWFEFAGNLLRITSSY